MPRKPLLRSNYLPYHVTTRSHNKEPFALKLERVWQLSLEALVESYKLEPVELVSFVLMNNHYHMILYTPRGNLDVFMYEFNKRLALKIQRETNQINQVFGGRYKWNLIESFEYYRNCYRYVFQNPIRAGLVLRCEDYRYSTLSKELKKNAFPLPLFDKWGFQDEFTMNWINQRLKDNEVSGIRKKLKRRVEKNESALQPKKEVT